MNDRRTVPEPDSLGYDDQVSTEEEQARARKIDLERQTKAYLHQEKGRELFAEGIRWL